MLRCRGDWSLQQSLRSAIFINKEIFGSTDMNTIYRWNSAIPMMLKRGEAPPPNSIVQQLRCLQPPIVWSC
eukprot:6482336-Amphidinium_carterae.1